MIVGVVLLGVLLVAACAVAVWQARQIRYLNREYEAVTRDAVEESVRCRSIDSLRARALRALDLLPDGVVICDVDGDVVARNERAEVFVDARHGDALVEAAVRDLRVAGAHGRTETRDLVLVGPPARMLRLFVRPITDGSVITIVDVSESRRVEALRRDFVANISHELRTPVGALTVLADTIVSEARRDLDADDVGGSSNSAVTVRLAERMLDEATRLSRTIDDLLELSRLEAGEPIDARAVELSSVVEEAVARVQPAAEARSVSFVLTGSLQGLALHADRRQLVSALSNLLDNAVKYSDEHASVEISARRDDGVVAIAVSDQGIGIPEADQERIFERFYRVDRARQRDTGGTGLGLAIVNHVARNHGGRIALRSREGEGSTFELHIPDALGHGRSDSAGSSPAGTDEGTSD